MHFTGWAATLSAAFFLSATVASGQRDTRTPAAAQTAAVATHASLVEKNCISCHNDKAKTGGLSLQGLSLTDIPAHGAIGRGHVAFAASDQDLKEWRWSLGNHKVPIEKELAWPRGGHSIYFRDPSGNSVELATPEIWGLGP